MLISCLTGKESLAAREGIAVLSEAYENLCSGGEAEEGGNGGSQETSQGPTQPVEDISAILAKEVDELKDVKKQPFYYHTLGIPSLVYVEVRYTKGPTPTELVAHACHVAKDSKQNKTRLCSRFYPIERVCASTMSEMEALAKEIADVHFPKDGNPVTVREKYFAVIASSFFAKLMLSFEKSDPPIPFIVRCSLL